MDALTKMAIETLRRENLPALIKFLNQIDTNSATTSMHPEDLQMMLYESRELLGILLKWSGSKDLGMTDTEALSMMLGFDKKAKDDSYDYVLEFDNQLFEIDFSRVSEFIMVHPNSIKQKNGQDYWERTKEKIVAVSYPDATGKNGRILKEAKRTTEDNHRILLGQTSPEQYFGIMVKDGIKNRAILGDKVWFSRSKT